MNDIDKVVRACEYAIRQLIIKGSCSFTSVDEHGYRYVIDWKDVIDSLYSIRELQAQIPKWHLCSDELPNKSGEYYCYVDYDGNKFYNVEEIDCDGFFKEWNLSGKVKVIAWMELPKFESEE